MQSYCSPGEQATDQEDTCFSKRRNDLDVHMTLYFANNNFCRPHGSLRHPDASGRMRKWTPMRELGITDRNWSLKELLISLFI